MKDHEIKLLCDAFAPVVMEAIQKATAPLEHRLNQLELHKSAKQILADSFVGVWQPALHERGTAATWEGSLWISRCDTTEKPGAGADWTLAVKRGKDGKDLRA